MVFVVLVVWLPLLLLVLMMMMLLVLCPRRLTMSLLPDYEHEGMTGLFSSVFDAGP